MKIFIELRQGYYEICQDYLEHFRRQGHLVVDLASSKPILQEMGQDKINALFADSEIVSVSNLKVTKEMLDLAPDLKLICMFGAGYDNIDIKAAGERGIPVVNSRGGAIAVAELAVSMMMALSRKLPVYDQEMRQNIWAAQMGCELYGKTVGVVGMGTIGKEVVKILHGGFNMNVLAHDVAENQELIRLYGVKYVSLEELFAQSDYISVHAPLIPSTRGMINERLLSLMKPTAFFVNASRGAVVVEEDLCHALEAGKLAGAGLDVFNPEPPKDNRFAHMRNVVMSPHSGSNTPETGWRIVKDLTQAVESVIAGQLPEYNVVNREYLQLKR